MKPAVRSRHSSTWNAWKEAEWPAPDAAAWRHACRAGGPLDRGGPGSALAPATRRSLVALYGMYLAWLEREGELDRDAAPETRFSLERVARFILARRAAVSDNTVFNNLGMIGLMLNCMLPGVDWTWIRRHPAAPARREAQAARQPQAMFDAGLLLHRILRELDSIHELPITWSLAVRQRDCVMLAVAMHAGVRLRNLLMMRLGQHLIPRAVGWDLVFDGDETKTGAPLLCPVPPVLRPAMERCLTAYREFLLQDEPPTDHVWISGRGGALSENGMRESFHRLGMRLLGDHLHPHEVRYVMASTLLTWRPNAVAVAAAALGHKETNTVNQYYDRSGFGVAQGAWRALRDKLTEGR